MEKKFLHSEQEYIEGFRNRVPIIIGDSFIDFRPIALSMAKSYNEKLKDYVDDVLQETILDTYQNIVNGKYEKKKNIKFSTYVGSIIRFKFLDLMKKKGFQEIELPRDIDSLYPLSDEMIPELEFIEFERGVRHKIAFLRKSCQELFKLMMSGIEDNSELMQVLGQTDGGLRRKKSNCRKDLKKLIMDDSFFDSYKHLWL